ncbi:hypothetical protein TRSC58_01363 [Trypanosoma rangeli SC58]|uniref:UBX domain-containing protein n=1 Tax=Trypanosoma rangeli SC58 TaxID=429131 RepID=A0A061J9V3_TRYRA|nr:hypothetical protein TRSC58_01363 [Trypanosoma rangeli SC58]
MSEDDVVATFMAMTSCSEEQAVDYLANANFDLAAAHSLYVAEHETQPARPPPTGHGVSSPSETSASGSPRHTVPPYLISRLDGGVGARQDHPLTALLGQQRLLNPFGIPFSTQPDTNSDADPASVLFTVPSFVHQSDTSFSQFCRRALSRDQWVLLSLVGDNFASMCVSRDIWRFEGVRETLNMFSIYQISAVSDRGGQLAHGYRIDVERDIPTLLIINPLTTMKESRIPLNLKGTTMDVSEVGETLLFFVAERGSPSQWEGKKHSARGADSVPVEVPGSPIVVEDHVDDAPEVVVSQPSQAEAEPTIDVVDISPYLVEDGETRAFSLRCRLPKGQATLRLNPATPAHLLVEYLAYRAYQEQPEAYPGGVPKCSLKTGYPPREVKVKDRGVQLATWDAVRSGDTVFLHIQ